MIKGFNLEVSLFLAKLMGTAIYTDTRVHWQHLHAHTNARLGNTAPAWTPLVEKVKSACFMLSGDPAVDFEHRMTGHFDGMRTSWREIMVADVMAGDHADVGSDARIGFAEPGGGDDDGRKVIGGEGNARESKDA